MWLLEFENDNVFYTYTNGERIMAYYSETTKIKRISNNQVQIQFAFDLDKGYMPTATITKEPCSDGESDMIHDYSISVQWEGSKNYGCGRKME